ncbi:hypothetical protein BpHYR1_031347 [Brachionus plicatilis]|uniref:Uncharacterized protein n=1 Tax=Brachionus plicatilis TaxID=10195 RepID=A0A3M7QZD6_BRAPC|nr:hypothetical protein BpHYR1_031347 [Brachionus plicatilis]
MTKNNFKLHFIIIPKVDFSITCSSCQKPSLKRTHFSDLYCTNGKGLIKKFYTAILAFNCKMELIHFDLFPSYLLIKKKENNKGLSEFDIYSFVFDKQPVKNIFVPEKI